MTSHSSDYARLIMTRKIHYVPTCLILEILSSIYGYTVRIPINRRTLEGERSRVIEVLEIFYNDLVCTLDAYDNGRMRFFSGDWKTNRLKAQRVFALFLGRLNRLHYFFWGTYQIQLKEFIRRLEKTWTALYALLDERCAALYNDGSNEKTRYFHSSDIESWQKTMANIIADLHANTESADDEYLLLICCAKVKTRLLNQIEQMREKRGEASTFNSDCILCVSHGEAGAACPLCLRFSDEMLYPSKAAPQNVSTPFPLHPAYQAALTREDPAPAKTSLFKTS